MAWLDLMVGICLTFPETGKLFSKVIIPLYEESVVFNKLPQ